MEFGRKGYQYSVGGHVDEREMCVGDSIRRRDRLGHVRAGKAKGIQLADTMCSTKQRRQRRHFYHVSRETKSQRNRVSEPHDEPTEHRRLLRPGTAAGACVGAEVRATISTVFHVKQP